MWRLWWNIIIMSIIITIINIAMNIKAMTIVIAMNAMIHTPTLNISPTDYVNFVGYVLSLGSLRKAPNIWKQVDLSLDTVCLIFGSGKKGNEEAGTPALVDNLTMSGGLCQEDAGRPLPSWRRGEKGFEKTKSQKDHLKKTKFRNSKKKLEQHEIHWLP